MLSFSGHKVVAVNEFFDSQLGDHVARSSLHGQAIMRLFGSDSKKFEKAVDSGMTADALEEVDRESGRTRRYPIGTTAVLDMGSSRLFLPALGRTETDSLEAYSSFEDFWHALDQLWRAARAGCNGEDLTMPLLGAGLSRVGLSNNDLLSVTLLSLALATRNGGTITHSVHILLTREVLEELDLSQVAPDWRRS